MRTIEHQAVVLESLRAVKREGLLEREVLATVQLDQIEKKVREAEFFASKMREQESRAFGDKEPFDLSERISKRRTDG